ncbi:MAG: MFS transporter, partial [Rhodocyclaceae bacterium]|nr:MFS transporter [Rhodocyclaceae bacterium]
MSAEPVPTDKPVAPRHSQFALLRERRFLPFFLTQFLGAFNDNLFKNALVVLITFEAVRYTTMAPGVLVNLAAGIFILPFFLFSASAGQFADKFEKSRLIRLVKLAEIAIMGLAALAFARDSLGLLLATLFLMGTQSSLFGPVKYAILPSHLREQELVGGNALVESGTFVAILLGTIVGGIMIATEGGALWVSLLALAVAIAGYLASRRIPAAPVADPSLRIGWNPFAETWRNIRFARSNRTVFLSVLGISWFWFYGALFLSQFPGYAREVLGGDEHSVTLLLAVFSVGIGLGSLLCERLSGRHVEIGLVPFGAIGLSLFALDLWWASPVAIHTGAALPIGEVLGQARSWRVIFDLVMIGAFGGFFIVPLYALVQSRSEPSRRSRVIAANNILNAAFMVVAALLGAGLLAAGTSIPQLVLLTALLNAVVAIYIFTLVPEFLLRFIVWLLVHFAYRLHIDGEERIPSTGPGLIVANHVS